MQKMLPGWADHIRLDEKLGVVDAVVAEPLGERTVTRTPLLTRLVMRLSTTQIIGGMDAAALIADRHNKYLTIGDSGLA